MRRNTSITIGLGLLLVLAARTGATAGDLSATEASARPKPVAGQDKPADQPGGPAHFPGCGAGCDSCWCGTPFENDCDPNWEDDNWCDCCCQFPDTLDCGGGSGCQPGESEDCNGNCFPDWWLGDGECDQGQYTYGGIPIYLNCPALNCDNGDCSPAECGVSGCPAGESEDCNGNCFPDWWLGDGECDQGQYVHGGVPIYLNCPELNCDNGDCTAAECGLSGCPAGEIEDCNGNCTPESWVGDGYCDDGAFLWNNIPIYLNCWQFDCDAYDCAAAQCGGCPADEIEDCNGHCAPNWWLGDSDCDQGQWLAHGVPIYFNCWEHGCDARDCPLAECGGCPVLGSEPPHCAIDARQPHAMFTPAVRYGWDWVEFTLGCPVPPVGPADFFVDQAPPGPLPPPQVVVVTTNSAGMLRLQLSGPINPGLWTCFQLMWPADLVPTPLGCLGYLPADADASRISDPSDIIAVIDHINNVIPRPIHGVDMDRSGVVDPSDIIAVIDLINGAGMFEPWMARNLPPCPLP